MPLGSADTLEVRRVDALPTPTELDPARPTVILLDRRLVESAGDGPRIIAELAGIAAIVGLGEPGEVAPDGIFRSEYLSSYFAVDAPAATIHALIRGAFRHAASLVTAHLAGEERALRHRELAELTSVGVALSTERNLLSLLDMILTQARRITSSDAASLYLVERGENGSTPMISSRCVRIGITSIDFVR